MLTASLPYLPKYFIRTAIAGLVLVLALCAALFFNKFISAEWIIFDVIETVGFFYFSYFFTRKWAGIKPKIFEQRLIWVSFLVRLCWVLFSYFYFLGATGKPFEYESADAMGYHNEGIWLSRLFTGNKFYVYLNYIGENYADMGYPLYLGALYYVLGPGILFPRIIKAVLGAVTALLVYRIARHHFGESTGRIAGVLTMLSPNLIYYSGIHVKETEMVFLVVVFVYYADKIFIGQRVAFLDVALLILSGASIFFFRTVLAVCLIASVFVAIFFISGRVTSTGRKVGVLVLLLVSIGVIYSTQLGTIIYEYIQESDRNLTAQMNNYSTTINANKLAKYGTKGVFLPLILIAPFPSFVETDQPNAMMIGGAVFDRNLYVFFVFIALWELYRRKLFRPHVLLLSGMFSYLVVLSLSGFAFSERFHLPVVPFLSIFTAYGISQMNHKNKRFFFPYVLFVILLVIGWNWFKLAGRT